MFNYQLKYLFTTVLVAITVYTISFPQYPSILKGIVMNAETKDPLPYANISIKNSPQGTIANQKGRFIFRLPSDSFRDTLVFSHLGFRPRWIAMKGLQSDSLKIELDPIIYTIREVTKRSVDIPGLLVEALNRIPDNYPDKPTGMTAFYRESIRENEQVIQLIEGVLGINKASYTDQKDNDRMMILKGRQKKEIDFTRLWQYVNFVDGPYEALESDVCKYPDRFIVLPRTRYNFLIPRYFDSYDYELVHVAEPDTMDYHLIRFKPKAGQKRAVLEGNIYLDRQSLAIIRLEYRINPYYLKKTPVIDYLTQVELQEMDIYTQTEAFNCAVNYQLFHDHWYLRDVQIYYKIILLWLNDMYLAEIDNSIQLVITDFDENLHYPINFWNPVRRKVPLNEQLGIPDEEFWENYNYLLKEE